MRTVKLTNELIPGFREYYLKYAKEHDESFPPPENYTVRNDEPVYLLLNEQGEIKGAAALMMHKQYAGIQKARFRIFHCITPDANHYQMLLDEILKNTGGFQTIYCYIPDNQVKTSETWEKLGFTIWRYSWILKRATDDCRAVSFPEGFEIRTMREGTDEQAWCDIINEAFANLSGHTEMIPEKIEEWRQSDPSFVKEGMKLVWHEDKPVATAAIIKENENGEDVIFIESIGVLNSYQGRGLGRNILRYGVQFAKDFGTKHVMLSVNAENEKAAELYLNEGFEKTELYICYHLKLN